MRYGHYTTRATAKAIAIEREPQASSAHRAWLLKLVLLLSGVLVFVLAGTYPA